MEASESLGHSSYKTASHRSSDVQVFKLRLELVHDGRNLLKLHRIDGLVQRFDDAAHVLGDALHRDGGLDARRNRVNLEQEMVHGELK